jgi:hypothetical protein
MEAFSQDVESEYKREKAKRQELEKQAAPE